MWSGHIAVAMNLLLRVRRKPLQQDPSARPMDREQAQEHEPVPGTQKPLYGQCGQVGGGAGGDTLIMSIVIPAGPRRKA